MQGLYASFLSQFRTSVRQRDDRTNNLPLHVAVIYIIDDHNGSGAPRTGVGGTSSQTRRQPRVQKRKGLMAESLRPKHDAILDILSDVSSHSKIRSAYGMGLAQEMVEDERETRPARQANSEDADLYSGPRAPSHLDHDRKDVRLAPHNLEMSMHCSWRLVSYGLYHLRRLENYYS